MDVSSGCMYVKVMKCLDISSLVSYRLCCRLCWLSCCMNCRGCIDVLIGNVGIICRCSSIIVVLNNVIVMNVLCQFQVFLISMFNGIFSIEVVVMFLKMIEVVRLMCCVGIRCVVSLLVMVQMLFMQNFISMCVVSSELMFGVSVDVRLVISSRFSSVYRMW